MPAACASSVRRLSCAYARRSCLERFTSFVMSLRTTSISASRRRCSSRYRSFTAGFSRWLRGRMSVNWRSVIKSRSGAGARRKSLSSLASCDGIVAVAAARRRVQRVGLRGRRVSDGCEVVDKRRADRAWMKRVACCRVLARKASREMDCNSSHDTAQFIVGRPGLTIT